MNLSLIAVVIINTVFAFVLITINKFLYSRGSVFDIYGFPLVIILGNLGYIIYLFCYRTKEKDVQVLEISGNYNLFVKNDLVKAEADFKKAEADFKHHCHRRN
jgi:hypothetical protein